MDRELEVAGAGSVGGWLKWRAHKTQPIGTPCANCKTPIQGPYCHACGQLAESFERSIWGLIVEGVESFFHFDGRFFHTLPNLAIHPARLTRDYLEGKRATQIPPFRLFLVVLLIVFFTGSLNLGGGKPKVEAKPPSSAAATQAKPGQTPTAQGAPTSNKVEVKPGGVTLMDIKFTEDNSPAVDSHGKPLTGFNLWVYQQDRLAMKNPEVFMLHLESWGHRFAILLLPISALLLSVLFIFQRRFYVFDHLIFSIHSLSFMGLLLSAMFLVAPFKSISDLIALAAPVHLFLHMRGTYQTSVFGTLLRMLLLFLGTAVAVVFLIIGLVGVGLSEMRAG